MLLGHVRPYEVSGRTESAALLLWFLETIYRLDDVEAQDAVCDRKQDAGIDAISVDDDRNEVVLFQAKRRSKLPATLGDTDLKEFVGSLQQFKSEASIRKLMKETKNDELRNLLEKEKVAEKVGGGYTIRPIFVCNVAANDDATAYIGHAQKAGHDIELWDLTRLKPVLDQLDRDWFVVDPIRLACRDNKMFIEGPKSQPRLVYAAVPAKELVRLPGIEDTRVFAQNVRLGLGRTRVNTEIITTLQNKREHKHFLTFHNGLTIVAKSLRVRGNTITLEEYSVCNGCQSLLAFYENRKRLTDELEVLVRVVRVGEDRGLPELIAYRTNNQNAISLRDLSSNDTGQLRLQSEFDQWYGDTATYVIKRGQEVDGDALHNEYAGRILLALYNRQPWNAHQKYRIFGDLESAIFSYDISAAHIRMAQLVMTAVEEEIARVSSERLRKYGLTKFLLCYLVGEVMRQEQDGNRILQDPKPHLSSKSLPLATDADLIDRLREQVAFVITELNYFVSERGAEAYDYKSEFKSPKATATLRNEILKAYEKDKYKGRVTPFEIPQKPKATKQSTQAGGAANKRTKRRK